MSSFSTSKARNFENFKRLNCEFFVDDKDNLKEIIKNLESCDKSLRLLEELNNFFKEWLNE